MTILKARPTRRSAVRTGVPLTTARVEGTLWAVGLTDTDVAAVRRAVAAALAPGSRWTRVRTLRDGRRRRMSKVESVLWADQMVRTADRVDGDVTRAHALAATPLGSAPFTVVVTPDAVVLRWHRAVASQPEAHLLLQRLVRAATAPPRVRALVAA